MTVSSTIFSNFVNLFSSQYSASQRQNCWLLEENDPSAKYSECLIKGNHQSRLIRISDISVNWTNILGLSHRKVHKKCDYFLIVLFNEKLYLFFIEMKGTQRYEEVQGGLNQIRNTYLYFQYITELIRRNCSDVSISRTDIEYRGIVLGYSKASLKPKKVEPKTCQETQLKYYILPALTELKISVLNLT